MASLNAPRALFLICEGGLGDVLMVMAAAKALKASFNCKVFLRTHPEYVPLAKACRHLDDAFSTIERFNELIANAITVYPEGGFLGMNLTNYMVSISQSHQVDAYLAKFSIEAPPHLKELELSADSAADDRADKLVSSWPALPAGKARILIHPALTDPHKTWPRARWEELTAHFMASGHQVAAIGERAPEIGRSVHDLAVDGLVSAVDQLDPLGTVALMRRAHLLVSTDSGPIQLAGATDIGIVGIYSIVAAKNRLPFRHGEAAWNAKGVAPACPAHPCFELLRDPELRKPFISGVRRALQEGRLSARHPFAEWCTMPQRYHCMTHEITVSAVLATCRDLMMHGQAL